MGMTAAQSAARPICIVIALIARSQERLVKVESFQKHHHKSSGKEELCDIPWDLFLSKERGKKKKKKG